MVVALMAGFGRFYVTRNFTDYVNNEALERLGELKDDLATEYQTQRGWQRLKDNPLLWEEMLRSSIPRNDFDNRRRFPQFSDFNSNPSDRFSQDRSPLKSRERLPRLAGGLALFDAQKQHVVGGTAGLSPESCTLGEISLNGRTVGWLGLHKREHLKNRLVVAFLKQQSRAFYLIGGPILLLAAIVAFILSRHFLAPIRRLTTGTHALSSRQFNTRIEVQSKDELGQLAADFNVMAQTLEKYEQMQKQWISDISHELRTPLAILQGEIEALQDGVRIMNPETLGSLQSEVVRMSRLVADLHLLALADSRGLDLKNEPVKPLQILRETLNLFQTRLKRQQIAVKLELEDHENIVLTGNPDQLTRLFINIIENTLKYTDSPGTLKIFSRHSNNTLTICFEDSAPAVPEDALEHLFDRLYRVDKSRSRELGGSGLGMSICKQIVEGHGGNIQAVNGPLGGLMITIELPINEIKSK